MNKEKEKAGSKYCHRCGMGGLAWKHFSWGWRLTNKYGQVHHCQEQTEIVIKGRRYISDKHGCIERIE